MSAPARIVTPDLLTLCALFPPADFLAGFEYVEPDQVPPIYHALLVHEHHMTVTVEAHHGDLVNVRVLDRHRAGDYYSRKILLALRGSGQVVQFGIVRINLAFCSEPVRDAIVSETTPLGRILIQHDVLRRIEPTGFLRVLPGRPMMHWFRLEHPEPTYGRLAIIHCDGRPAIELLEIVSPEGPDPGRW